MNHINYPCCNAVLPITYDNSLSYYEQVCKLTSKMNEMIDTFNGKANEVVIANIDKYFNSVMINAIGDENNNSITLKKVVK